jgi:hypothetical protein
MSVVFAGHRIERADFRALAAGFHFHEEQEFAIAGDDVHLAAAPAFEVPARIRQPCARRKSAATCSP